MVARLTLLSVDSWDGSDGRAESGAGGKDRGVCKAGDLKPECSEGERALKEKWVLVPVLRPVLRPGLWPGETALRKSM